MMTVRSERDKGSRRGSAPASVAARSPLAQVGRTLSAVDEVGPLRSRGHHRRRVGLEVVIIVTPASCNRWEEGSRAEQASASGASSLAPLLPSMCSGGDERFGRATLHTCKLVKETAWVAWEESGSGRRCCQPKLELSRRGKPG